jgi:hypothetical protein
MNTQLASWTELRHDNLLYAKQSYTGGITCSYPQGYVEPFPDFFKALMDYAFNTKIKIQDLDADTRSIESYLDDFYSVCDTLRSISEKELAEQELSQEEKKFISGLLYEVNICGIEFDGWYTKIHYGFGKAEMMKDDRIVADYHTAPTDAFGSMIGWVKHAGTGRMNMAVVVAKNCAGEFTAFAGPVSGYYEYTTTNFQRLTDDEWKSQFWNSSTRPEWTNIYLADNNGNVKPEGVSLVTSIESLPDDSVTPENYITAKNYPNPFNPETIIKFTIPSSLTNELVKISVYDIQGRLIKVLLNDHLQSGSYLLKWDGTNELNLVVSSGTYLYRIVAGESQYVGKMNLVK